MVAPYTMGRLTRSLVPLPGSGHGGHREPVCIDFSRVSTTAAIAAAHYPPPSGLPRPPHMRTSSRDVRKMASGSDAAIAEATGVSRGVSGTAMPLNVNAGSARGANNSSSMQRGPRRKRPRGQQEGATASPAKAPRPTAMAVPRTPLGSRAMAGGSVSLQAGVQGAQVVMVPAGPAVVVEGDSVRGLVEERDRLRQQNAALAQRVRAFQMLFRNKDKLTGVLRVMGLTVV